MMNALGVRRRWWVRLLVVAASVAFGPSYAGAQSLPVLPSGAIRGAVSDERGQPIENAEVVVRQLQHVTVTSATGRFAVSNVKSGKYNVDVRAIGYSNASARVSVGDTAVTVTFTLKRVSFTLPARITTASRGGLSGVIADTGYKALVNARIRIIGMPDETLTDSAGAFFLPLPPGRYLVRLERDGYARQLIGVSVPESEGREIAAWMMPSKGRDNPRIGANLFDMRQRLMGVDFAGTARPMNGPATSRVFAREDIDKLGYRDLLSFVRATAGVPVGSDCWVTINGGPRRDPLWRTSLIDVEFIELYHRLVPRTVPGRPTSGQDAGSRLDRATAPNNSCAVSVFVWTRQ